MLSFGIYPDFPLKLARERRTRRAGWWPLMEQRRDMMTKWADYLDRLRTRKWSR